MKVYVFKRDTGYDRYDGIVIVAETMESAVAMRDNAIYVKTPSWNLVFCEKVDYHKEEVLLKSYKG